MFYIKFVSIINKNHEITNKSFTSIFRVFWQYTIYDILEQIMYISKTKIYYYIFFKNFS